MAYLLSLTKEQDGHVPLLTNVFATLAIGKDEKKKSYKDETERERERERKRAGGRGVVARVKEIIIMIKSMFIKVDAICI